MITLKDYFGIYATSDEVTPKHRANAELLLDRVNTALRRCLETGHVDLETNPKTGTLVSGVTDGGWRPRNCRTGASRSSHKEGKGVDVYDPDGDIDNCIMENRNWLTELGLAIEHPASTRGWCHFTTRIPPSGNRIFYP